MLLSRLRSPLLIAAWVGAVWCYWRSEVSLQPTTVIPLEANQRLAGVLAGGELVVARYNNPERHLWDWRFDGPCTLYDPATGRRIGKRLDPEDRLILSGSSLNGARHLMVHRGDQVVLIDATSGELQMAVPDDLAAVFRTPRFSPDGRLVAFFAAKSLQVFRAESGDLLWSESNLASFHFAGPDLIRVIREDGDEWRDSQTGMPAWHLENSDWPSRVSRSGRYRICWHTDSDEAFVSDLRSGAQLWTMPAAAARHSLFSEDESEVLVIEQVDGRLGVARWRTEDGVVLAPFRSASSDASVPELDTLTCFSTGDGTALVIRDSAEGIRLPVPQFVLSRFQQSGSQWNGALTRDRRLNTVIDARSGRRMGHVEIAAEEGPPGPWAIPAGAGFVIDDEHRLLYFAAPFRRNWRALLAWGLIPPLGVLAMGRWRRNKRRSMPEV